MLILGGSTEASALASALAGEHDVAATLSLAGRVRQPSPQPLPTRVGGFGGVVGLADYLRAEQIEVLVDATHPFAATMSRNARDAAQLAHVVLLEAGRPSWQPAAGDRWTQVETMTAAAAAIGALPHRVFLTIGRLQLAPFVAMPQHHYVVRSIEPVGADHTFASADFITARGPFTVDDELALMRDHRVDVLVTKNSGGTASVAKIEAARQLALPVVLVRAPSAGSAQLGVDGVLAAIRQRLERDRHLERDA